MHHTSKRPKGRPEAAKEAHQGKVEEPPKPTEKAVWTRQQMLWQPPKLWEIDKRCPD